MVLASVVLLAAPRSLPAQPCPTLPGDAFAFLSPDSATTCPADPIVRWQDPRVVFECDFFTRPDTVLDCGASNDTCAATCRDAAAVWNADLQGRFQLVAADASTPVAFCDSTDGRTSVGGSTSFCGGRQFGGNILAVTLRVTVASGPDRGRMIDSDVVVNKAFHFTPLLLHATIAHELGHVLGLDHPDQCGKDFNVLMRSALQRPVSDPCFVSAPTTDDIHGAQRIYPQLVVPTPVPLCGDADGDGAITDTDGVLVLRAAAGLSSACTSAACDVDGDGAITTGDAVAVLRAAVELPAALSCR